MAQCGRFACVVKPQRSASYRISWYECFFGSILGNICTSVEAMVRKLARTPAPATYSGLRHCRSPTLPAPMAPFATATPTAEYETTNEPWGRWTAVVFLIRICRHCPDSSDATTKVRHSIAVATFTFPRTLWPLRNQHRRQWAAGTEIAVSHPSHWSYFLPVSLNPLPRVVAAAAAAENHKKWKMTWEVENQARPTERPAIPGPFPISLSECLRASETLSSNY